MDLGGLLRNIVPWFPPGDAQATPPEPQPPMQPSQMSAVDIYRQGVGLPPIEKVPPLDRDPAGFYPGRYDPFEIAAERTRASVMPIHGREESGASYPVQSALQAFPPLDLTPVHLPGTEPKDYLRELYRNPEILQKGIEQASNFNFGGTIGKAGGVGDMIRAYHGSPHDFERFDLSKIGTGEGAQAYGHGLYFAENEGVAKGYRDNLGVTPRANAHNWNPDGTPNRAGQVASELDARIPEDEIRQGLRVKEPNASEKQIDEWVAKGRDLYADAQKGGRMYEVGIRANPEHFLDWDKPLSEQHPKVRDILKGKIGENEPIAAALGRAYNNPMHAGDILGKDRATPEELTRGLAEAGIPGIKYLDQGSRDPMKMKELASDLAQYREAAKHWEATGNTEKLNIANKQIEVLERRLKQTSNYVVFDDKLIDILKKYGIAGIGALPAMNAYHYQDSQ